MAELTDAVKHLVAFSVFSVLTSTLTALVIWKRRFGVASLRLLSVIPHSISAALATKLYNAIRNKRYPTDFQLYYLDRLKTTYSILAVVSVFAGAWASLMWFVLFKVKGRARRKNLHAKIMGRCKSRAYFYVLVADLAMAGSLIAGVVLSSSFIPWNMNRCRDDEYSLSKLISGIRLAANDAKNIEACQRGVSIHVMAAATAALIFLQDIMILPLANLPSGIRFAIYIFLRLLRRPPRKGHGDLESGKSESDAIPMEEEPSPFFDKHSHHAYLISALQQAKGVPLTQLAQHQEILANNSQCWACDAVICNDCKVAKTGIDAPRTTHHITDCYAICTGCFLIKGSQQPAAFSAILNTGNLSLQHRGCSSEQVGKVNKTVEVCPTCAKLTVDQIRGVREAREQALLAKTLVRRILCATCEKPMPKNKRRWWICGPGDHECHWVGHEVLH